MPQILPILIYIAINAAAYYVAAALIAINIAYGNRQRKKAERQQRDAYNASLQDRSVVLRSTDLPKSFAFGEVVVGGAMYYAGSFGSLKETLYYGFVLGPGHQIDSIVDVALNDEWIGQLDGSGDPVNIGPYKTERSDRELHHVVLSAQNANQYVVLGNIPFTGSVQAYWIPDQNKLQKISIPIISVIGNTVHLDSSSIPTTYYLLFVYRVSVSSNWVRVEKHLGAPVETASPLLTANTGGEVIASDRGDNCPSVVLRLSYSEDVFPNGIPSPKCKIRGALLYDPRKDSTNGGVGAHRYTDPLTWEYSSNPALVLRYYLTSPLGEGALNSEIDDGLVISAANVCDEWAMLLSPGFINVTNGSKIVTGAGTSFDPSLHIGRWLEVGGGFYRIASVQNAAQVTLEVNYVGVTAFGQEYTLQERRYECHGVIASDISIGANLDIIAESMGGTVTFAQGKWRMYPGAYRAPGITLYESDILSGSPFMVQARADPAELFNAVKGQFIDPLQNYQVTDYPAITSSVYEAQDGGERIFAAGGNLSFPLTNSASMAQRLALIVLEQARQAMTVQATFSMRAYQYWPGETIAITSPNHGFFDKTFRIVEREFSLSYLGVRLTLREESPSVYSALEPSPYTYDLNPNTNLPDVRVIDPITGLMVESGTETMIRAVDGTLLPRIKVSWTGVSDSNVTDGGKIEIEYEAADDAPTYLAARTVPGDSTFAYIDNVQELASYMVRVRAVNGAGVRSHWTYIPAFHTVIGKTEPPSNVDGFTSEITRNGILIKWDEATDIDYASTELRYSTLLVGGIIITNKRSRTHLWGWQPADTYTVLAKHYDTSGNASSAFAVQNIIILAPLTPSFSATVIANNVLLSWSDATTTQPIGLYRFKIGPVFASAALIGTAGGDSRFETYFSTATGTQKIWIQAEDVAGNVGTPTSVDVVLSAPLGFKQRTDFASTFSGTKVNAIVYDGGLLMAVNATETWSQHFTVGHTWNTSQDKINAGFPVHATPSQASGSYEEVFDFGSTLVPATTIAATVASTTVGNGTLTINLSVSNVSSTGPWTAGPVNATTWTTTGIRWVRVQIAWAGDGGSNDLVSLKDLRVRLSQQKLTETGSLNCISTDATGTVFTFVEPYAIVDSIQVTPVGVTDRRAVVNFTYTTVNPTTCRVLLFDAAGARVTGDVRLQIEGFQ